MLLHVLGGAVAARAVAVAFGLARPAPVARRAEALGSRRLLGQGTARVRHGGGGGVGRRVFVGLDGLDFVYVLRTLVKRILYATETMQFEPRRFEIPNNKRLEIYDFPVAPCLKEVLNTVLLSWYQYTST